MSSDQHNLAAKIARAFTYNKPLSLLVVIAVILAGTGAFWLTPKQYNPEIERPAFQVTVSYPGARAAEVERFVTRELVEKVGELEGVDEVTARSIDGGRAVATVLFEVGEDLERSKVRLFTQLEENLDLRQGDIQEPRISYIDPDSVPIVTIAFSSAQLSQNEVRSKVIAIQNELRQIPGTANLRVRGGEPRALSVVLDQAALRERSVAVGDVLKAIEASNVKQVHDPITDGERVIDLETDGTIKNVSDAREIIIRPGVHLGDVATISDGYREKNTMVLYSQDQPPPATPAVYLSVAKRKEAGAPAVAEAVRSRLAVLQEREAYADLDLQVVRDDGRIASEEIQGLGTNLLISIAIVGAVLLLFLSWRPALVVMIAIPLTLLLVFGVGYLFGQTINRITLFALILSLGLLVDSATVVVENIYRRLQEKKGERRPKIVAAVHQVGTGLLLSTITSVVVFIPMRYITGMMGPYMGPVAFFVPVALIMALGVAFVVTPFLSHMLLDESGGGKAGSSEKSRRDPFAPVIRVYERFQRAVLYSRRKQDLMLLGVGLLLVVVLTFPVLKWVHFQMLPKADKQEYSVYVDMPEGSGVERTREMSERIARVIHQQEYTRSIQWYVGEPPVTNFNGLFRGVQERTAPHQATLKVNLVPPEERWSNSSAIVSRTRQQVLERVSLPQAAAIRFVEIPPGPPVRATLVADIKHGERPGREDLARTLAGIVAETPGAVDVDTSIATAHPRILVEVDTNKALLAGLSPRTVARTLAVVSGPTVAGQYHPFDQDEFAPIELKLARQDRDEPADFRRVDIRGQQGALVPLASVTEHIYSRNVPVIYSDGLAPTTQVTGEVDNRSIVYIMLDVINALREYAARPETGQITSLGLYGLEYQAPEGETYRIDWGGEWELTLDNFRDLGAAMLVAFFTVFVILVAQYRSFIIPALIMATVPFGLVGILPGFAILDLIAGVPLTATALIGFIALIGIVVNNAIIYLEYFTQLTESGEMEEREALIEAGKVRMRPIVLTSLTTVLASLTIALDPAWSGLAWSIVFGLSLSAFMTLGIFPVLFARFKLGKGSTGSGRRPQA